MKTLILSCNTGEGHNSCAKAIKEYYDMRGEVCDIIDGLSFISEGWSRFISGGHVFIYRHLPWLFKVAYRHFEEKDSYFDEGKALYRLFARGSERLYEYIRDRGYDAVICPHVFTALMLTDMLKKHPISLATCFIATDYTCSPSGRNSNLDYYFIPDEEIASDFECENITQDKMVFTTIPVRQMFYLNHNNNEAKQTVGVDPDNKHLVMMCGSMGCGPMKRILKRVSEKMPTDWEVSVICGNNSGLLRELNRKYGDNKKIHIRGFVKDMGMMMDSADLYLTKPGGISVSEAYTKALPMVFINAVGGCEENNRIIFVRRGCAETKESVNELVDTCLSIMQDDERRLEMKKSLAEGKKQNSSEIIYNKMKELTNYKKGLYYD